MMTMFVDPKRAREFLLESDKQLFQGLKVAEIESVWTDAKCLWVANAEVFMLTGQGEEDDFIAIAGKKPEK
jgi:hypothetical protein